MAKCLRQCNREKLQELMNYMKELEAKMEELIAVVADMDDDEEEAPRKRPEGPKQYSVAACVTAKEKRDIDNLCHKYSQKQGWEMTRGALLRLVWLHFLDNHEGIDLDEYRD